MYSTSLLCLAPPPPSSTRGSQHHGHHLLLLRVPHRRCPPSHVDPHGAALHLQVRHLYDVLLSRFVSTLVLPSYCRLSFPGLHPHVNRPHKSLMCWSVGVFPIYVRLYSDILVPVSFCSTFVPNFPNFPIFPIFPSPHPPLVGRPPPAFSSSEPASWWSKNNPNKNPTTNRSRTCTPRLPRSAP